MMTIRAGCCVISVVVLTNAGKRNLPAVLSPSVRAIKEQHLSKKSILIWFIIIHITKICPLRLFP